MAACGRPLTSELGRARFARTMARTTLRDIAAQTGFAHSTVSLALRGKAKVDEKTRSAILSAAEKLGYRPHPLISALMASRRSRMGKAIRAQLGFLRFHGEKADSMSFTTIQVLEGATARAKEFGYHLLTLWADDPAIADNRIAQILEARGVHGVVLGPAPRSSASLALPWDRFGCITLNLGEPIGADYVGHNYYEGMKLALHKCLERGYERIGVALPKWKNALMLEQYLMPFLAREPAFPRRKRVPPLLYPLQPEPQFLRWIDQHKPDVIISSIDSEQGTEFVRRHVPRRIAYISLNTLPGTVEGIDQNRPLIGAVAVDQLVAKLNRNERGLMEHAHLTYVVGRWADAPNAGSSTAPSSRASS